MARNATAIHYRPRDTEVLETAPDLAIQGEDPEASPYGVGDTSDKPTRVLTDFSIFEPRRDHEMVSLGLVVQRNGDNVIEAAGYVTAEINNEEDAGQEDEDEEEAEESVYLRLGPILRVHVAYEPEHESVSYGSGDLGANTVPQDQCA
jgi:DNA (cytosine-5)-methyltransferase 1